MDLYAILGVERDASAAAIRAAYRKAAKRAHPDGGGSVESFALVRTAVEVLSDDERRKQYDETGQVGDKPVGNRESRAPGIGAFVEQFMREVLLSLYYEPAR